MIPEQIFFLGAAIPGWVIQVYVVLLGLVLGSFANVVILRLPRKESVVRPRSRCCSCGKTISWYDNIPILSFIFLRGRCRRCGKKLSWRYPVIEAMTAALFYAALTRYGWSALLLYRDFPFLWLLVVIAWIDLDHRLILDVVSLPGLVLGLLTSFFVPGFSFVESVLGAGLGFGIFYAFAWLYERRTGKMGLGGGDIKLLAMLGAFLGPEGVFLTIFLSSISGSLIGILIALISNQGSLLKTAIPYGPFLILGSLYYYFFGGLSWLQFTTPM